MTLEDAVEQADRFLWHFEEDEQLKEIVTAVSHYDLGSVHQGIQDIVSTGEVTGEVLDSISSGEHAVEAYQTRVEGGTRKHLSSLEVQAEEILGLRDAYVEAVDTALLSAIKGLDDSRDALSTEKDLTKKAEKRKVANAAYEKVKKILPFAEPKPGALMGFHAYEHLSSQVIQMDSEIDSLITEYLSSPMTNKDVKRFRKASKVSGFGKGDLAERCKRYDFPEGRERLARVWKEVSTLSADDYSRISRAYDDQSLKIEEYTGFLDSFSVSDSDLSVLAEIKGWNESFHLVQSDSMYFGKAALALTLAKEKVAEEYDAAIQQIQDLIYEVSEATVMAGTREGNKKRLEVLSRGKKLVRKIGDAGLEVSVPEEVRAFSKSIRRAQYIENEYSVLERIQKEANYLHAGLEKGVTESLINHYVGIRKRIQEQPEIPGEYQDKKEDLESGLQQIGGEMERGMYTQFQAAQEEGKPIDTLMRMASTLDSVQPQTGFLQEMEGYVVSQAQKKAEVDEHITRLQQEVAGYQKTVDDLSGKVNTAGSKSEVLQEQIEEGKENISTLTKYITALKQGHEQEIGALTEELSIQAGRLKSTQAQIEDRIYREKESLKRELSGRERYSLNDFLEEGTQPYSFGALKLQTAVTSGKPWMERLQDLGSELGAMPPLWHSSDVEFSKRLYQGIGIESTDGELKDVLTLGPRKEVYDRVMGALKNYIAQSEKAF